MNTPGTIDAGYRGEVKVLLVDLDPAEPIELRRGDRVAQLVLQRVEQAAFTEVEVLPESVRGGGGYGSTGGFGTETRPATQGANAREFRRKAQSDAVDDDGTVDDLVEEEGADAQDLLADGPFDSEELPAEEVERLDLGSLLIIPEPNLAAPPGRRGERGRAVRGHPGPDGALDSGPSRAAQRRPLVRRSPRSPRRSPRRAARPRSARGRAAPS